MGVVKLASRLLTTWIAFLYPTFASYKALSHRPVSEPELQRWVKYWSIVGVFVGAEYLFEWLVDWFPFYWEAKTVIVLYFALPQTQGSTFIYDKYLGPYFQRNEASLDRNIETAQKNLILFARERVEALVQFAWDAVRQTQAQVRSQQETNAPPPPTGSPAAVVSNLWRTYGSSIIAGISRASASVGVTEQIVNLSAASGSGSGSGSNPASTSANPVHRTDSASSVIQSRNSYLAEEED